jgi:hypothetical protein
MYRVELCHDDNLIYLGESLLNDAVAIVLCGAIEDYSRFSLTGDDNNADIILHEIYSSEYSR